MESQLALTRGDWSLHVAAEAQPGPLPSTRVHITAMEAPTLSAFAENLASSLAGQTARGANLQGAEFQEQFGDQAYRTTIRTSSLSPSTAGETRLHELQSQGWQVVWVTPNAGSQAGFSAGLVKGKDAYALLSANPLTGGKGSSVAFTEVKPD
jgi:hypothetical protein